MNKYEVCEACLVSSSGICEDCLEACEDYLAEEERGAEEAFQDYIDREDVYMDR